MNELYTGTSTPIPHQHFECPQCGACHSRGMFGLGGGVGAYRCLRCGYVGRGYHPDPGIDLEIAQDSEAAERESISMGGPFFVGVPPEAPPLGYAPTEEDIYRARMRLGDAGERFDVDGDRNASALAAEREACAEVCKSFAVKCLLDARQAASAEDHGLNLSAAQAAFCCRELIRNMPK